MIHYTEIEMLICKNEVPASEFPKSIASFLKDMSKMLHSNSIITATEEIQLEDKKLEANKLLLEQLVKEAQDKINKGE